MIPFFRKIRKKMADDNRPLKYMRYAIGEIVLVVVGILIALQINNWNEDRKGKLELEVYQKRLIEDLVKDTIALHNFIEESESENLRWLNIKTEIEKPSSTIDTIIRYFERCNMGYMPRLDNKNDATYKSLVSTGDIQLFEDSHRMLLLDFYNYVEPRYDFILIWQDEARSDFAETFTEFGWLTKVNKNNLIYYELRKDLDQNKLIKMFDVIVGRRSFFYGNYTIAAEEILNETNKVLDSLNNHLN